MNFFDKVFDISSIHSKSIILPVVSDDEEIPKSVAVELVSVS